MGVLPVKVCTGIGMCGMLAKPPFQDPEARTKTMNRRLYIYDTYQLSACLPPRRLLPQLLTAPVLSSR